MGSEKLALCIRSCNSDFEVFQTFLWQNSVDSASIFSRQVILPSGFPKCLFSTVSIAVRIRKGITKLPKFTNTNETMPFQIWMSSYSREANLSTKCKRMPDKKNKEQDWYLSELTSTFACLSHSLPHLKHVLAFFRHSDSLSCL